MQLTTYYATLFFLYRQYHCSKTFGPGLSSIDATPTLLASLPAAPQFLFDAILGVIFQNVINEVQALQPFLHPCKRYTEIRIWI